MCHENAFGSEIVGMGIVVVASERDVVEDMEAEESGEVVEEEESIITTCTIGGEEARWTKMSTMGGEVATISREADGGAIVVEVTSGDFGCSASISLPSWSGSS